MARKGARKRTLILKYRMRFKYGLKAQKLLAQGSALGYELLTFQGVLLA